MPTYTQVLSVILMRRASALLKRKREGRRAFAHFCFHAVLQGRSEIDVILLTGTWTAPAKAHAASISYLETIHSRYRSLQHVHLRNLFKQPECIIHAGFSDVIKL